MPFFCPRVAFWPHPGFLWGILLGCSDFHFLPTNGVSIKPPTVIHIYPVLVTQFFSCTLFPLFFWVAEFSKMLQAARFFQKGSLTVFFVFRLFLLVPQEWVQAPRLFQKGPCFLLFCLFFWCPKNGSKPRDFFRRFSSLPSSSSSSSCFFPRVTEPHRAQGTWGDRLVVASWLPTLLLAAGLGWRQLGPAERALAAAGLYFLAATPTAPSRLRGFLLMLAFDALKNKNK